MVEINEYALRITARCDPENDRVTVLRLPAEVEVALHKLLGATSPDERIAKGLTPLESDMIAAIWVNVL